MVEPQSLIAFVRDAEAGLGALSVSAARRVAAQLAAKAVFDADAREGLATWEGLGETTQLAYLTATTIALDAPTIEAGAQQLHAADSASDGYTLTSWRTRMCDQRHERLRTMALAFRALGRAA